MNSEIHNTNLIGKCKSFPKHKPKRGEQNGFSKL